MNGLNNDVFNIIQYLITASTSDATHIEENWYIGREPHVVHTGLADVTRMLFNLRQTFSTFLMISTPHFQPTNPTPHVLSSMSCLQRRMCRLVLNVAMVSMVWSSMSQMSCLQCLASMSKFSCLHGLIASSSMSELSPMSSMSRLSCLVLKVYNVWSPCLHGLVVFHVSSTMSQMSQRS